ncbi:hypothetical protein NLJ89_g1714 [Agrocybe chaxingu]|uniref:Uncharacterized protein n=1 Tax=Agrocybe chaxingu TaxID=84603 RepID=A0A9W8MZH7_9AGAR|nr:hypothetical protein NLJ89_g1714 [Agrocybe chaxingu]
MFLFSGKAALKMQTSILNLDSKILQATSDEQVAVSPSSAQGPRPSAVQGISQEDWTQVRNDEESTAVPPTMESPAPKRPPSSSKGLPPIPDDSELGFISIDKPNSSTLPAPIAYPPFPRAFLHNLAALEILEVPPLLEPSPDTITAASNKPLPSFSPLTALSPPTPSTSADPNDEEQRRRRRRRPQNTTFAMLQSIAESADALSPPPYTPSLPSPRLRSQLSESPASYRNSAYSVDEDVAKKIAERAKLRRMQSLQDIDVKHGKSKSEIARPPVPVLALPKPAPPSSGNHQRAQSEPIPPIVAVPTIPTTTAPPLPARSSKTENVEVPANDSSSLVSLRRRLNEALHELRDSREANERLAIDLDKERDLRFKQKADDTTQLARYAQMEETMQALQKRLDRALRELRDSREANEREKNQHRQENDRLRIMNDQVDQLALDKHRLADRLSQVEGELKDSKIQVLTLKKEKQTWQEQLDTMHNKMVGAERRMRHLDNLTHAKLDARQDGAFGTTGRSKLLANSREMSGEVLSAVIKFNEEVSQTASLLAERLERLPNNRSFFIGSSPARTKQVLGEKVLALLEAQARDRMPKMHLPLMQTVLEVFLVHWSVAIIDASYPKQQTFADVLVELSSGRTMSASSTGTQIICGRRVQILQPEVKTPSFENWATDVIRDLIPVLQTGGVQMSSPSVSLFTSKVKTLIQLAYELRLAMAEKDICGVEIMSFSPETVFLSKYMDNAHEIVGRKKAPVKRTSTEAEYIAGTSGLGLQRVGSSGGSASRVIILRSRVALMSAFKENA